ncbi:MAG: nitrous oxide reductase family maturation protein NosD [Candidatus Hodarchaeota archaeon]
MGSTLKIKILVLILICVLFAFSSIFRIDLNIIEGNNDNNSDYTNDFILENEKLKLSTISEKIHINNNWTDAKNAGICTGFGTYSEPYIIEDLVIDGGGSGSCILIENSKVYFRIENCTLFNSGSESHDAGIKLDHTNNGELIDNNCSFNNNIGIYLLSSDNNDIMGNIVRNNSGLLRGGIELRNNCDDNTISGNLVSNSSGMAILISNCNKNHIFGNNVSYNVNGIWVVSESEKNNVSGNMIYDNEVMGIYVGDSKYNIISGNIVNNHSYGSMVIDRSDINIVSGNIINYGDFALGDSTGNLLYRNCFIESVGHDYGSNNHWDNGTTGNYWSDYTGLDLDNNGIGDSPYNVSGSAGSQDNFPLMNCGGLIMEQKRPWDKKNQIPGFNLFFLLGFISIGIIITRTLKKMKEIIGTISP